MQHAPTDPLFERLQDLRPQLADHIRLLPQDYRGERWYVLADEAHGRYMRFNARAYAALGRFDGRIKLADLFTLVNANEHTLTQQELAGLVLQLSNLNALHQALPEDVQAMTGNSGKNSRGQSFNPLAMRFRLFDPDQFLEVAMPWVQPLFSKTAAAFWCATVLFAVLLGITHVTEIDAALNSNLLAPKNLLLGWLVFTLMKVVHEFAHAFAVKLWGGEVHEMGISLLVLMPVPYVDASASSAFSDKYRRALVGAIGIIVELWIAAAALIVFVGVEPGLVRDIALNALLIGTISTLLINGNPLLRFDGYYVLQDLFELPNLSSRSSAYLRYLAQHYILRLDDTHSPVTAHGERRWLFGYGIAAGIYRVFILCVIALFLASKYLVVGVALVTWAVVLQIILPTVRGVGFMLREKRLRGRRTPAILRAAVLPAVVVAALTLIPAQNTTVVQGIVWLPEQAQLYARSSGVVAEIWVEHGSQVETGTPLFRLHNPDLDLRRKVIAARLREAEASHYAAQFSDLTAAGVAVEERKAIAAELASVNEDIAALEVTSPHRGTLVYANSQTMDGHFVNQGELLAYIVNQDELVVRSVISQRDIGRVQAGVEDVEIRLAERLNERLAASIVRKTPAGHTQLVSRALARVGGGEIDTDITDPKDIVTTDQVFNVDLSLPAQTAVNGIGGRAFVRYNHGRKPLFAQWQERLRQLVLRRLAV